MTDAYRKAGVDVKEGDSFSVFAYELCRSTYECSPFVTVLDHSFKNFRGPKGWVYKNLPGGCFYGAAPDGIGTKVALIDVISSYQNAARDWVAMTCGDITRWGGIPLILVNQLDTATLDQASGAINSAYRAMMLGLCNTARHESLIMIQGETAQLGPCVGSPNPHALLKFNWSGTALGVYHPNKMILGDSLAAGQIVVALREYGFGSNGISLVREAFIKRFDPDFWTNPEAKRFLVAAAAPSTLYDRFLTLVNGWYSQTLTPLVSMRLITHITGGGIPAKFARDMLLPRGFSAVLDDLWEPPDIMKKCAEWLCISDRECYETWNGGQRILIVIDEMSLPIFLHLAHMWGVEAKVCGFIKKETGTPTVRIRSKFHADTWVVVTPSSDA